MPGIPFSAIKQGFSKGAKALGKGKDRLKGVGQGFTPGKAGNFVQENLITGMPWKDVKHAAAHPMQDPGKAMLLGMFTAGGLAFGYEGIVKPIAEAGRPVELREAIELDRRQRKESELARIRFAEKRKRAMESLARLAALDPHLYNELTAGRRLPQGAMTFGGQPRTDLLESLAADMAEGHYQQEPDPDQELAALFGGM